MPITQDLKFEKREATQYPVLPKGIYQAELLDVKEEENETYDSKMGNTNGVKEYQTDLSWQFTLLSGRDENQQKEEHKNLRGRNVWENFGQSFLYTGKNGKNNLYRIVEAFLGRELTREEESSGITSEMLNSFIGKQVNLSVETKTSKTGKSFDNIIDYFMPQTKINSLTPEEREKSTIKKDNGDTDTDRGAQDNNAPMPEQNEIDVSSIPM